MSLTLALQSLDESILRVALATPTPLVTAFVILTTIGGGWGLFALVPFALRRSTRASTLWLFGATALTSGVVSLIKLIVGRVRPCDALPWCAAMAVKSPGGPSFPSGHAAGAFAFATFVTMRAPRFGPAVYLFALLVAWSRCVLGVHYPTDIFTGAIVGTAIGALVAHRTARREKGGEPQAETAR